MSPARSEILPGVLEVMRGLEGSYLPGFCAFSALHRPGAWEWTTGLAASARGLLLERGYRCVPDDGIWYRVRWELGEPAELPTWGGLVARELARREGAL